MCDNDDQNPTSPLSLLDLPIEILLHICSYLDAKSLVHGLSLVCKEFNRILNHDSLWKARISNIWPHTGFPILPPAEEDEMFCKLSCVAIERQSILWGKEDGKIDMEKLSLSNGHYGTIDSVLLLNNAKICVSGARDRSLIYWSLPNEGTSNPVSNIKSNAHDGWIWDLTALGDTIYSCSWDQTIKAWELTNTGLVFSKAYHIEGTGALLSVTSCLDLNLLAVGSFCKTVLIFDPRFESSPIYEYRPHQRAIVQISMNTNYIFSASEDQTVSIWDQRTRKIMKTVKVSNECFPMSLSVQKGIVYVGDNGGKLHVLDPSKDFDLVKSYATGHKKAITGVHCAPGCLITSSLDKTVRFTSPTDPPCPLATLISTYGEVASMHYLNEVLAMTGTDGMEIWRPKNRA